MCSLPEYEKIASFDSMVTDEQTIGYPTGPSVGGQVEARRVVFTYSPIWPRPGTTQHISGLLAPTPHQTISNVQTYFPHLSHISPDRISFRIPVLDDPTLAASLLSFAGNLGNPGTHGRMVGAHAARSGPVGGWQALEQWAEVRPEVWESFKWDTPRRMAVVVADEPGEGLKRTLRTLAFILALTLGPIALVVGLFGLLVILDI